MAECGTYAALQQHKLHGEKPCDPCLEAGREYMAEWRKRPGKAESNRSYVRAANRAKSDLVRAFPVEYRAFLDTRLREERQK